MYLYRNVWEKLSYAKYPLGKEGSSTGFISLEEKEDWNTLLLWRVTLSVLDYFYFSEMHEGVLLLLFKTGVNVFEVEAVFRFYGLLVRF